MTHWQQNHNGQSPAQALAAVPPTTESILASEVAALRKVSVAYAAMLDNALNVARAETLRADSAELILVNVREQADVAEQEAADLRAEVQELKTKTNELLALPSLAHRHEAEISRKDSEIALLKKQLNNARREAEHTPSAALEPDDYQELGSPVG